MSSYRAGNSLPATEVAPLTFLTCKCTNEGNHQRSLAPASLESDWGREGEAGGVGRTGKGGAGSVKGTVPLTWISSYLSLNLFFWLSEFFFSYNDIQFMSSSIYLVKTRPVKEPRGRRDVYLSKNKNNHCKTEFSYIHSKYDRQILAYYDKHL